MSDERNEGRSPLWNGSRDEGPQRPHTPTLDGLVAVVDQPEEQPALLHCPCGWQVYSRATAKIAMVSNSCPLTGDELALTVEDVAKLADELRDVHAFPIRTFFQKVQFPVTVVCDCGDSELELVESGVEEECVKCRRHYVITADAEMYMVIDKKLARPDTLRTGQPVAPTASGEVDSRPTIAPAGPDEETRVGEPVPLVETSDVPDDAQTSERVSPPPEESGHQMVQAPDADPSDFEGKSPTAPGVIPEEELVALELMASLAAAASGPAQGPAFDQSGMAVLDVNCPECRRVFTVNRELGAAMCPHCRAVFEVLVAGGRVEFVRCVVPGNKLPPPTPLDAGGRTQQGFVSPVPPRQDPPTLDQPLAQLDVLRDKSRERSQPGESEASALPAPAEAIPLSAIAAPTGVGPSFKLVDVSRARLRASVSLGPKDRQSTGEIRPAARRLPRWVHGAFGVLGLGFCVLLGIVLNQGALLKENTRRSQAAEQKSAAAEEQSKAAAKDSAEAVLKSARAEVEAKTARKTADKANTRLDTQEAAREKLDKELAASARSVAAFQKATNTAIGNIKGQVARQSADLRQTIARAQATLDQIKRDLASANAAPAKRVPPSFLPAKVPKMRPPDHLIRRRND